VKSFHGSGAAEGQFPAKRLLPRGQEFAALTELLFHAACNAGIVPGCSHAANAISGEPL
jgi:hypothetical protein